MMAQSTICIDRQAVSASRSGELSAVRLASIWARHRLRILNITKKITMQADEGTSHANTALDIADTVGPRPTKACGSSLSAREFRRWLG